MHPFVAYYIRSALPFVTGIAFILLADHMEMPLPLRVALGGVLVVVGPFTIQLVLTLIVEALRGPEQGAPAGVPTGTRGQVFDFPARLRR